MAKVAVVIGASRGIGFGLANELVRKGYEVFGTVRKPLAQQASFKVIEGVDVASEDCKAVIAKGLEGVNKIDLFVYNAGIGDEDWSRRSVTALQKDKMFHVLGVNMFGCVYAVQAAFDKFSAGSRLFLVTSRVGSCGDNGSGGFTEYRVSKTALNMLGINLYHEFKPKGVMVYLMHPGMVATDMTGKNGIPVEECVEGFSKCFDTFGEKENGGFFHAVSGEQLPW